MNRYIFWHMVHICPLVAMSSGALSRVFQRCPYLSVYVRSYRCSVCGQPKRGHKCTHVEDIVLRKTTKRVRVESRRRAEATAMQKVIRFFLIHIALIYLHYFSIWCSSLFHAATELGFSMTIRQTHLATPAFEHAAHKLVIEST